MTHFISAIAKALKEGGVRKALDVAKDEGFWNCILDGNLLLAKLRRSEKNAVLVGIDRFGNKYFENRGDSQYVTKTRWVEYGDKNHYDASSVPAEWHGWLHYMTDHTAQQLEGFKPNRYGIEHKQNPTGAGEGYIYHAKGHYFNPKQRGWTRYAAWKTESSDSTSTGGSK